MHNMERTTREFWIAMKWLASAALYKCCNNKFAFNLFKLPLPSGCKIQNTKQLERAKRSIKTKQSREPQTCILS